MRIAILGATGLVGSFISKQLSKDFDKATIIACSRTKRKGHFLFDPFSDNWSVLGELDILINCVGIINETKTASFEKAHVDLARLICINRGSIGQPRIIQISAIGAALNSPFLYFESKGRADELLLQEANTFIVKPSVICSPNSAMVKQLRNTRVLCLFFLNTLPFPKSNFHIQLQPVLQDDLAELVSELCLVDFAPKVIEAVGKDVITVRKLFKLLNRFLLLIPVPKKAFDKFFYFVSPLLKLFISKTQYQLLSNNNIGDPSKMEELLGRPVNGSLDYWRREFKA